MAEVTKIAETSSQGLEPANPKLVSQYDQLRSLLASRLTPDHAFMFAEPVAIGGASESGKDTAWYTRGVGTPKILSSMSPDHIAYYQQRIGTMVGEINALAEELISSGGVARELGRLLRDALVFPSSSQIYVVDEKPVIVGWGFRQQAGASSSGAGAGNFLSGIGRNRTAAPSSKALGIAGGSAGARGGVSGSDVATGSDAVSQDTALLVPERTRHGFGARRWFTATALWLLFLALCIGSGLRLLDACALGSGAWPAFVRGLVSSQCELAVNSSELQAANDKARMIEESIRQKQLMIAAKLAKCDVSCPAPSPLPIVAPTPIVVPTPPPLPEPAVNTDGHYTPAIERGRIEVTLVWNGPADLDLHVFCPDGKKIFHQVRREIVCGGKLMDDLNRGGGSADAKPIEHAVWTGMPTPSGQYRVAVDLYQKANDPRPSIPFTAIFRVDGKIRKLENGTASQEKSLQTMFTFEVPTDVSGDANAR